MTYEVDDEEPVRGIWELSADGYATFFPEYSPSVVEASGLQLVGVMTSLNLALEIFKTDSTNG